MLSSPLRQHILNYEPSCGFVMPTFTMFDGFNDPYDRSHALLQSGNDTKRWQRPSIVQSIPG